MSTRERGERGDLNYVFHKVGKCGESKFKFEKILVENFLSVEPGSGHKGKNFSNFWKHVFFANWTIQNRLAKKIFFRKLSRRATRDRATGAIFGLKYLRKLKRNRCPVFFCCSQSLFCTFCPKIIEICIVLSEIFSKNLQF